MAEQDVPEPEAEPRKLGEGPGTAASLLIVRGKQGPLVVLKFKDKVAFVAMTADEARVLATALVRRATQVDALNAQEAGP